MKVNISGKERGEQKKKKKNPAKYYKCTQWKKTREKKD